MAKRHKTGDEPGRRYDVTRRAVSVTVCNLAEEGPSMATETITTAVTPGLQYRDAQAAIQWLVDVLGFRTAALFEDMGGPVHYAQLVWRTGAISLSPREEAPRLPETGPASIALTAEDRAAVDALYERALAAGAEVLLPPEDTFYGNHGFTLRDPEGNLWHVGTPWLESDAAHQLPQRAV